MKDLSPSVFLASSARVEIHGDENRPATRNAAERSWQESRVTGPGRLFLRFWRLEIILGCFQTGRMNQWARAHFFVGRDGWWDAGASMPGVPAVEGRDGVHVWRGRMGGTGTCRLNGFESAGVVRWFQPDCLCEAK